VVRSTHAAASHAVGDLAAARRDYSELLTIERWWEPSGGLARHHLDLGELHIARPLIADVLEIALAKAWHDVVAWSHVLLGRLAIAEGTNPRQHLDKVRAWASRTGGMEYVIEAHLLSARHSLASSDLQAARDEAETGLLHAVACGYGLLRIELLVALARIRLAWPDPPKAIQAAREALDLATHPDCQYAWGEADAAQVWGEAYFANHEPALAQRAFTQALAVLKRIEHPCVAETKRWLGMVAGA
jgi:tetratricopeptide (TPR) repeat protein